MKNKFFSSLVLFFFTFYLTAQELAPYVKVGDRNESISDVSTKVIEALKINSFTILGSYTPGNNTHLKVIAFTNNALKNTVVKVTDRGALAVAF